MFNAIISKVAKFYLIISAIFILSSVDIVHANNGQIAYAYPIDDIKIDGDLSDWSDNLTKFPIAKSSSLKMIKGDTDFKAFFRVGYNKKDKSLYFATEITDDSYVVAKDKNTAWEDQDRFLLYLDKDHFRTGSGNFYIDVTEKSRTLSSAKKIWDPLNAKVNWKNTRYKLSRRGNKTICEWKVFLGDYVQPNKSIGLDYLIVDKDKNEKDSILITWGNGTGKSVITTNLGDLMLLEVDTPIAELQGTVKWKGDSKQPLSNKIRITSAKNPKLWVMADVDKEGNYSAKMPVGEYDIDSPFETSLPFVVDAKAKPLRIDETVTQRVTVKENQVNKAPDLELVTFKPPEYLIQDKGVLYDYDSSKSLMIDNFIETYRRYYGVTGVSVALVKDEKVIYHKNFGVKNNLTKELVDDSTLFEAASITKSVFAFAVMRLAERGVIDLDKPLHEYLEFKNVAEDERYKLITARIVLSHKTGMENWAFGGPGGWRNGGKTKLNFNPGEKFGYSGEAYNYLGRVLEKITGNKLNQILQEEVLTPFGMTNTYFSNNEKLEKAAAVGHINSFPMFFGIIDFPSPASSMHTEAKDFSKFMIGLLNKKGLSEKTYAEMWKPVTSVPKEEIIYENGWKQDVSLGFFVEDSPHGKIIGHGGNNGDFHCKFGIVPEKNVGFAIYTNNNAGDKLFRAIERFLLFGNTVKN